MFYLLSKILESSEKMRFTHSHSQPGRKTEESPA